MNLVKLKKMSTRINRTTLLRWMTKKKKKNPLGAMSLAEATLLTLPFKINKSVSDMYKRGSLPTS